MERVIIKFPSLLCLMLLNLCACSRSDLGPAPVPDDYEESIREWKQYRIDVLTGPTNWLRLDGIYWLNDGENSFGSGEDQDLQFPDGTIPEHAGNFYLENGVITMQVADGVTITHEGNPVQNMILFDGDERPRVEHGDLEWFIDTRDNRHGIRLYNKDNPKADAFEGFPAYPLDPDWHLKAKFVPNSDSTTIVVDNVIGEEVERYSPGNIEFMIDGNVHSVIAFEANSGLFIIVADETNRTETYHAGRYMIIPFPDENKETVIDFNKAYNPPCAFSRFTTCQLPPQQNRLDVAITAGEKRPVGWDGL
ncbi:MAG: DUF1684 domain-containing protein [Balneolaceae bacterium]|nr:DUF1684 domain-containing protein [Balneolaceae bacterium]